jgi:hypothetical protein
MQSLLIWRAKPVPLEPERPTPFGIQGVSAIAVNRLQPWLTRRVAECLDQLVTALDGCPIPGCSPSVDWTVLVRSVYREENMAFLQLSSAAHPGANLVLRVSPAATVKHLLAALRQWTPSAQPSMTVLTVVQQP